MFISQRIDPYGSTPCVPRLNAHIFATLTASRRASSERGRSGGVQRREPKQEKVIPPEDRHKFIYDGEEYTRPPNLFDVGGGELKLLPEVLSDLSFEARDFADDGTAAEQKDLRDSRPWGRLYVDGWPAPMQYLRSHFGGPAVEGMRPLVLASPLDACEPLRNGDSAGTELRRMQTFTPTRSSRRPLYPVPCFCL